MHEEADISIMPRWRVTRWLVDAGPGVPDPIRAALVAGLYGTIPIFLGGVFSTLAVSAVIAGRIATWPFVLWAGFELVLTAVRLIVLTRGRRAIAARRAGPTDLYILLALLWAAAIGYGSFISIASGDWVAATLACMSASGMVGGICFRNFGAPRLAGCMIVLSLGPLALAAGLSGEPILAVIAVQIPFYVYAMTVAAHRMCRLLVKTIAAERAAGHQARHDPLTGLLNRTGLDAQVRLWSDSGATLSLFYLDLDGFKAVNDRYGHAAGDRLLGAVAERLCAIVRPADAVARIGGDEFVIVSNSLDRDGAARVGARVVAEVSTRGYALGLRSVKIGLSVGIARAEHPGATLAGLMHDADRALYRAKARGRLCCVMADEPEPEPGAGSAAAA